MYGDALRLPFGENCFDAVLLLDVLEHLPDAELALSEAVRVTRPGGSVIIQIPFLYPLHDQPYDFQRITEHGLCRLLSKHGLCVAYIQHTGKPIQTAAALLSIALAQSILDCIKRAEARALLAFVLIPLIPLVNISGWLLSTVLPDSKFMPLSYKVVAVKE